MSMQTMDMSSLARLVPVTEVNVGGADVPTCNARELHCYLGVRRDFSNWINGRITKYGFAEGTDYATEFGSPNLASQSKRGGNRNPVTEYHLTLDMAKELAMVENNPMGRQVRRYFIECERNANRGQYDTDRQPARRIPWVERSNEDRQVELKTIAAYGRYCSHAAAWWYATEHANVPPPPLVYQPAWRQAEMGFPHPPRVTTISIVEGDI